MDNNNGSQKLHVIETGKDHVYNLMDRKKIA